MKLVQLLVLLAIAVQLPNFALTEEKAPPVAVVAAASRY
jgi:hypothetical protein